MSDPDPDLSTNEPPEPLTQRDGSGFPPDSRLGKGSSAPTSMNREPSDDKLRSKIAEFRKLGMNQTQIIYAIWGAKKGGSKAYADALEEYKRLAG